MNNENYKGYIYCIINLLNSKKYIGQTKRSPEKRKKEHFICGTGKYIYKNEGNKILYKAMKKDGVDSFIFLVLATVITDSKDGLRDYLNELEMAYIKELNTLIPNGYNMTSGGTIDGCIYSNCKKVAQYGFDGKLINVYESISEAGRRTGICGQSIGLACIGKNKISGNYIWRYVKDNETIPQKIEPLNHWRKPRIIQINNDGNIVNEFTSVAEASNTTKINNVLIGDCIRHRYGRLSAGGYRWVEVPYDLDISNLHFDKFASQPKGNKKVNQYDLDGNFLNSYESLVLAALNNKIPYTSCISDCCKGNIKQTHGYKWYYANDLKQPDKTRIIKW